MQSKLFTFYIGKEKKAFVVHSKAIAATSWHFHALVSNGMVQSQEGSVEYPDMDACDFARFVEYAYRNDYTPPSWTMDERTLEELQLEALEAEQALAAEQAEETLRSSAVVTETLVDLNPYTGLKTSKAKREAKMRAKAARETQSLRQSFGERQYLMQNEPRMQIQRDFVPKGNSKRTQDFTPIFLAHARLYTFACMRLIDPLKRLALYKLHQTLLLFKLYSRRVGDVIDLARYAYDHGEDRKPNGTIEDLRKLVVEYIVCEVSTIGKHEAFAILLQEGGEFVVDFWGIIAKENLGLYA
ncbi:hypothetical protein B0T12DRAFT_353470 [Alternaria alternata]|nr:hypothetical protein B0T12DRAFT_353470 [Alternaria alternata]